MPELTIESMLASLASTYPDCPQIAESEPRAALAEKLDRHTPETVKLAIDALAWAANERGQTLTKLPPAARMQTACEVAHAMHATRFERALDAARQKQARQIADGLPTSAVQRFSERLDEWPKDNYEQAGRWLEAVALLPVDQQDHLLEQVNVALMTVLGPTFDLDREHWTNLHACMLSILDEIGITIVPVDRTREQAAPMPVGGWPWSKA